MEVSASSRHFRLIGISLDDHDLKQYVDSRNLSFPVYSNVVEGDQVRLGMGETPQTILIANDTVVRNWAGAYSSDTKKEIEATLGIKFPVSVDR